MRSPLLHNTTAAVRVAFGVMCRSYNTLHISNLNLLRYINQHRLWKGVGSLNTLIYYVSIGVYTPRYDQYIILNIHKFKDFKLEKTLVFHVSMVINLKSLTKYISSI